MRSEHIRFWIHNSQFLRMFWKLDQILEPFRQRGRQAALTGSWFWACKHGRQPSSAGVLWPPLDARGRQAWHLGAIGGIWTSSHDLSNHWAHVCKQPSDLNSLQSQSRGGVQTPSSCVWPNIPRPNAPVVTVLQRLHPFWWCASSPRVHRTGREYVGDRQVSWGGAIWHDKRQESQRSGILPGLGQHQGTQSQGGDRILAGDIGCNQRCHIRTIDDQSRESEGQMGDSCPIGASLWRNHLNPFHHCRRAWFTWVPPQDASRSESGDPAGATGVFALLASAPVSRPARLWKTQSWLQGLHGEEWGDLIYARHSPHSQECRGTNAKLLADHHVWSAVCGCLGCTAKWHVASSLLWQRCNVWSPSCTLVPRLILLNCAIDMCEWSNALVSSEVLKWYPSVSSDVLKSYPSRMLYLPNEARMPDIILELLEETCWHLVAFGVPFRLSPLNFVTEPFATKIGVPWMLEGAFVMSLLVAHIQAAYLHTCTDRLWRLQTALTGMVGCSVTSPWVLKS